MPHLFVYGTLRTPIGGPPGDTHYHHRIADEIISSRLARLAHAALYDFGPYPGIGVAATEVVGEVFEISNDALTAADEIEGHPDFYERRLATVTYDDDTTGEAWVYWAPPGLLQDAALVESGDWFRRDRREDAVSIDDHLEAAKTNNRRNPDSDGDIDRTT